MFTVKFNIHVHVSSVLLSRIDIPVTPPYSIGKKNIVTHKDRPAPGMGKSNCFK